jgi:hypothetical protein
MAGRNFWVCGLTALIPLFAEGCGGQASRDLAGSSGGSGGTSGAGGTTGTAATWVTDLSAAYCTWAIRCGEFPDADACNASKGPQFAAVNFNAPSAAIKAVSKGTATFDPTQATSCLAALSNLDCGSDSDLFGSPPLPASCASVFSGTVSDGGACIDDVECGSGSMCVMASTATCQGICTPASGGSCRTSDDCPAQQYCAAVPIQGSGLGGSGSCQALIAPGANAGDPCGAPVQCAPGLRCFGPIAPVHCAADAAAPAGAACGGDEGPDCAPGLVCVTSDDGTTATCALPAKLGDACTSLFQCGAQYDLSDIICDESHTHTCVHRPSTGRCNVVYGLNTCDPASSFCDAASATCKPWLSQGSSCVFPASGIDPCAPGSSCGTSVCASLLTACTPE